MSDRKTILILDYDGTLHDSRAVYEPAFRKVMDEISKAGWIEEAEYTSEEISYWVGFSAQEMWMKFHPELSEKQQNEAGSRIGNYMLEAIGEGKGVLYSQVPEVLDSLKEKYELLFLSNCDRKYMEAHRKAFDLDRWFSQYFCTGDYGWSSKEEVFEKYIRQKNRNYIAVGDRIKDIALAKKCGFTAIGCLYGFGSREELAEADILIDDITKLRAAADELSNVKA